MLTSTREAIPIRFIGTSFRRIGFDGLARYAIPADQPWRIAELRAACGASELVWVQTCNRVECYMVPGAEVAAEDEGALAARVARFFSADPADLFARSGAQALGHLFDVVTSLDSLVIGECEIAGQVRRAVEEARRAGLVGPVLERAFERAAAVAKRARTETAIGATPVSVASLCVRRIREHLAGTPGGRVVLVGVGEVTCKVAHSLADAAVELLFVNRTLERAQAVAAGHGGDAVSLEAFLAAPPAEIDVLVAATGASEVVIPAAALAPALSARAGRRPILVCDLAMPRNVDPALDGAPGVLAVGLADLEAIALENRRRLEGEVAAVRLIVGEEVARFAQAWRMRAVAEESVERFLERGLGHLEEADRDAIRSFAGRLADRLARQPAAACARGIRCSACPARAACGGWATAS